MAGVGRPDSVRSKSKSKNHPVNRGGSSPTVSPAWASFDHANLGRSGKVPRGKRHQLCGRAISGPVICSGIMAGWIKQGLTAELVRTRFADSESGAERYAAQLYVQYLGISKALRSGEHQPVEVTK